MSEATLFSDVLKSAPTVTSFSGLSMLLADGSGKLQKADRRKVFLHHGQAPDCDQMTSFGVWNPSSDALNAPPGLVNTSDSVIFLGANATYGVQLYVPMFYTQRGVFIRRLTNSAFAQWDTLIPASSIT